MNLLAPVSTDPGFAWNEKAARHLLNRAGFGVPPTAVAKLAALTPEAAVASFVDFDRFPDVGPEPPELPDPVDYRELYKAGGGTEMEKRQVRQEIRRKEKEAMVALQVWWIERMCKSQRPLQEKIALMWHGHFATSAEKVQDPTMNFALNKIFREQGTGNFRELVRAVGKSPAMLRYLDQQQSSNKKPNENWARELMELFTLGIGNYTEKDIKEAARAFTGWTQNKGQFYFAARRHDEGIKTIFGASGRYNGDDVVNMVTGKPECAKFICTKLWKFFAYEDPEPEVIEGLAETFKRHEYNLRPVLRQMFLSRAFYQEKAFFSQVKSPAQLVAGLMVQLDAEDEQVAMIAAYAMRAMGQSLFYPPNVKGWDGGRAWINTNTLLVRYNFSNFLVSGVIPDLKGSPGGNVVRRQFLMAAMGKKSEGGEDDGGGMMQSGGSMMSGQSDDDTPDAPAGQDAMARDIPAKTFYNKLRERRDKARDNRTMSKEERRERYMLDQAMNIAPFEARQFYTSKYTGKTADEIVDDLAQYFLGFAIEETQRQKLKAVLAQGVAPDRPVPVDRMAEEDLRATIQLLLSTIDYQVC